jgi:hypothetical protein
MCNNTNLTFLCIDNTTYINQSECNVTDCDNPEPISIAVIVGPVVGGTVFITGIAIAATAAVIASGILRRAHVATEPVATAELAITDVVVMNENNPLHQNQHIEYEGLNEL